MRMNPIRKATTAGSTVTYEFDLLVSRFLVKNLSGGDVTVRIDEDGAESWLIPDEAWQIIPGADKRPYRQKLYVTAEITSDRGVEVEAVDYVLPKQVKI